MKPHPRIRKTIKWGGVVVCVLLLIVWVWSGWWISRLHVIDGWFGGVGAGCVAIGRFPSPEVWPTRIVTRNLADRPIVNWWFGRWAAGGEWLIKVPFWVIIAPLAGITVAAWRLDTLARRRARTGLCPKCHYDRAGLAPSTACPECGTPPPAPSPA